MQSAWPVSCQCASQNDRSPTNLVRDLLLLLAGKVDEVVVFGADQERDGGLVEASPLPVPFLNGIECALAGQVEHEEYGDSVVADQGQHVDELALASQVPDGEGDFCVPDGDGLLHEVDTCHCQRCADVGILQHVPSVWM